MCWVYLLKNKFDIFETFKNLLEIILRQGGELVLANQ